MENKYVEVEFFLKDVLSIVSEELDSESINSVEHYLAHAEYEMAFEGLFIEIMKLDIFPIIDLEKARKIALLLKLDEDSVFEPDFWKQFESYIEKRK